MIVDLPGKHKTLELLFIWTRLQMLEIKVTVYVVYLGDQG